MVRGPIPEHHRKYLRVYSESSFSEDFKYVIKNSMSLTDKQTQAFEVRNSEFRTIRKRIHSYILRCYFVFV